MMNWLRAKALKFLGIDGHWKAIDRIERGHVALSVVCDALKKRGKGVISLDDLVDLRKDVASLRTEWSKLDKTHVVNAREINKEFGALANRFNGVEMDISKLDIELRAMRKSAKAKATRRRK